MKKYYYTIITILFFGLISCSNEETKIQNQVANRPTVPLQNGEVQIGNQVWMTKNLNVSSYRNGDPIPQVIDPTQWANLTTGAWCYYNNDPANGQIYGKLYNWYAVNDPRGLAPINWHVATDMEWRIMTDFLTGVYVGGKLKSKTYWLPPNTGATNSSGFSGLPGGQRNFDGVFYSITIFGLWWTGTQSTAANAWFRGLQYNNATIARYSNGYKNAGFSVRCIKD
jgi:uncharacterized protein (TIGR02145 family)